MGIVGNGGLMPTGTRWLADLKSKLTTNYFKTPPTT